MQKEALIPMKLLGALLTRLDDPRKRNIGLQLFEEIKRVKRY